MPDDLSHDAFGPAGGIPLVALHGFPLHRGMWTNQVAPWTAAGHRLILPDLPGHGESAASKGPATMELCSDRVLGLLDRLKIQKVVLAGFSLGGYVALDFTRRHPERVMGLVLVDTRAEADTEEARKKRFDTAAAVRSRGMAVLEEAMVPKFFTEATRRQRPALVKDVVGMIHKMTPEAAAHALEGMAARPDQRSLLPTILVPTLIVVGEKDELTPPAASEAMAHSIPGARLERIEDAAHLTPMEAPARFNGITTAFLASLRRDVAAVSGTGSTAAKKGAATSASG